MVSRTTQSYQLLDSSSSIAHHLLTLLVKTRTRGSVSIHCVKHRSIPLYSWRTFVTSATSFLTSWFWGLSRASRQARASGLFSLLMISRMRTRRGGIRLGDMQRLLSRGSVAQMHNVGAATLGTAMKWLGRVCRLWRWRTFMVLHGLRETHRRSVESSPECYPEERAMLYWGCSSRVIFVQGEPRIWRTSKHPLRFCSWEDDNNLLTGRFGDSHYSTVLLLFECESKSIKNHWLHRKWPCCVKVRVISRCRQLLMRLHSSTSRSIPLTRLWRLSVINKYFGRFRWKFKFKYHWNEGKV